MKDTTNIVADATNRSYNVLTENVGNFYDSPESPNYKRTGQLADSPQLDGISNTPFGAIGQISINTTTQYDPSGRDTNWIYHAAENDELWGNGGFWAKTESEIREILTEEVQKRFGK